MPGNEVRDPIHNFFDQENLSQGQHHSQVVDGTWPGFNNHLWVGSQRQIGPPLISSNLKSFNVQPSADSERGHGGQSSSVPHGLNSAQSALNSELVRSQSHNQQPNLNGFMHGHQALHARHNESNFMGMDPEYNRHNLTARGLQIHDWQLGNGPELNRKNSMGLESSESPVNYDFFGGQQRMTSQHSSTSQPSPRHQSGNNDIQLLQQQVMLKKLQELHRQHQMHNPQFEQQEARQHGSINQVSSTTKQAACAQASGLFNGTPVQDATTNYSLQSELMAASAKWLQSNTSPAMQGSSSGRLFSPDQGQMGVMGYVPQQDQSLYGIPVSSTRINQSQYSPVQIDKSTLQQIPASRNSFPGNEYAAFPGQVGVQDENMASRQGYQGGNVFMSGAEQGLTSGLDLENLQQMNTHQRSAPIREFPERQGLFCPSETSQAKTATPDATSQNAATLDPEEEKILFGSDENLWDAFGRSTTVSGCSNTLDNTEFLGAVPSLQSGSWSALMQSAVAETSSGDLGMQEGWSGLGVQNSESPAAAQQLLYVSDGSKQPSAWADNNLQTVSAMNSRPLPLSGEANTSSNYSSVSGVRQSVSKPSHEGSGKLQNDSSKRLVQQFSGEGSKWLDRSPVQQPVSDSSRFSGNVACSSDAELHEKGHSASWSRQNRQNGWNFIDSGLSGPTWKDQSENTSQHNQSIECKSSMHDKIGHSASEHANSAIQLVNREPSNLNNEAALSDSSTIRANQKNSQQFSNNHNLNFWKNVDSSVNPKGSDVLGKYQQHPDKSRQDIESSGHDGPDNRGVELETENSNARDKTSDSHHSNISHRTNNVFRENVWLDATDSRTLPGEKQKSSSHFGRKHSGTRKFQYHPMGDVDIDTESSSGMKNVANSQGLVGHDQAYFGKAKCFGLSGNSCAETEKGGFQGDVKYMDERPSKSMHPSYAHLASAPFDKSVGNYTLNRNASSSQNMLELLHKVDQTKERSHAVFSSSDHNRAQMPEAEVFDRSVDHLQQNQSSTSQGFGLQLGPPSQRLFNADTATSSQSSSQASLSSIHVASNMGKRGNAWLGSNAPVQSLHPSRETSQGCPRDDISTTLGHISDHPSQCNFPRNFSSGLPYSRSHLQNQQMTGVGAQATSSQPVKQIGDSSETTQSSQAAQALVSDMSKGSPHGDFNSAAEESLLISNIQSRSAQQFPVLEATPVLQPSVIPGVSQQNAFSKMSHNAWASALTPQSSSVSKTSPTSFKTHLQSANNLGRSSPGPEKQNDQIAPKEENGPSDFAACSAKPQGLIRDELTAKEQQVSLENDVGQKIMNAPQLQGQDSAVNSLGDSTLSNSSTAQRDIEAFGRSLKPNNMLHQNYSLLHQMLAMKSTENDPDNRCTKRFKGPDSVLNASQVAPVGVQQLSTIHTPVPPGDSKMLSFSSKFGDNCGKKDSAHDTPAFTHNGSQRSGDGTGAFAVRGEQSQISPQMAPSWFDQYGTFKNGQMLSVYDAQKITAVNTMEQSFAVGKASNSLHVGHPTQANAVADARQFYNIQQSSVPMSVASEHISSPQCLPVVTTDQSLFHLRPKKRKSPISEVVPWHKEVTQGLARLHNISMSEAEWSQAANRLMKKVEDETELIDDGPPMLRSKRRLILTTQLMQQLLRPPQTNFLSSDASSHYETVTYVVARSALGDACSSVSFSKSDTSVHDSGNLVSEKCKTPERIGDQYISKAIENFADRAKKLEESISRLDKRASILDLRVECQDLEKFSVINRFAKFHGRVQAEGVEASSATDANAQKFFPQRYVTALPIPRNLPDRRCIISCGKQSPNSVRPTGIGALKLKIVSIRTSKRVGSSAPPS